MAKHELNNKQLRAVEMLVYSKMQKQEIARELDISNSTLSVWLSKPEFEEALKAEMYRGFQPLAYKAR